MYLSRFAQRLTSDDDIHERIIMKRQMIVTIITMLMSSILLAQASTNKAPIKVGKSIDPATRAKLLAATGGFTQLQAKGPALSIVNLQSRVPSLDIQQMIDGMKAISRIPIVLGDKSGKDLFVLAKAAASQAETLGAIIICDVKSQPALLVVPEEGWAAINLGVLGQDVSDAILKTRVAKELWRATGYLLGVVNPALDHSMMGSVKTLSDLDAITGQMLNAEILIKVQQNAVKQGVSPSRMSTYKKACEEGWAPMPTNSIQKAIWEEVKAKK